MAEFFAWFTDMSHTKPFALVLFFITFVGILIYVFSSKQRSARLESYKHIPLDDEDKPVQADIREANIQVLKNGSRKKQVS